MSIMGYRNLLDCSCVWLKDYESADAAVMYTAYCNAVPRCRSFESVMQVYQHVTREHFETNTAPVQICRWAGCDNVPRQRWSLMTHLQVVALPLAHD